MSPGCATTRGSVSPVPAGWDAGCAGSGPHRLYATSNRGRPRNVDRSIWQSCATRSSEAPSASITWWEIATCPSGSLEPVVVPEPEGAAEEARPTKKAAPMATITNAALAPRTILRSGGALGSVLAAPVVPGQTGARPGPAALEDGAPAAANAARSPSTSFREVDGALKGPGEAALGGGKAGGASSGRGMIAGANPIGGNAGGGVEPACGGSVWRRADASTASAGMLAMGVGRSPCCSAGTASANAADTGAPNEVLPAGDAGA